MIFSESEVETPKCMLNPARFFIFFYQVALRNNTNEARNVSSNTSIKHDAQHQRKGLLKLIFLNCLLDNSDTP